MARAVEKVPTKKCLWCLAVFARVDTPHGRSNWGRKVYCSTKCADTARNARLRAARDKRPVQKPGQRFLEPMVTSEGKDLSASLRDAVQAHPEFGEMLLNPLSTLGDVNVSSAYAFGKTSMQKMSGKTV